MVYSAVRSEQTTRTQSRHYERVRSLRTIAAIKEMYSGDSNDKDMPDADMFIKAQDWDDDWNQITVLHSDFDAVCTNVYVAFGKKQDHVIADCLVEEQGKWKVRSATLIK